MECTLRPSSLVAAVRLRDQRTCASEKFPWPTIEIQKKRLRCQKSGPTEESQNIRWNVNRYVEKIAVKNELRNKYFDQKRHLYIGSIFYLKVEW